MLFYKIAFLFLLGAFVVLGESWEYSNATSMTGIFRGIIEGLTATDDGNFLLCSKYWMVKATPDLQTVIETQKGMIPEDLLKEGYDHIGDIDFLDGVIIAPVEDRNYEKPAFFLFDGSTYELIDYKPQPNILTHMPWVAYNPSTSLIYSSEFSDVNDLKTFTYPEMDFVGTVQLKETLPHGVQGGAFFENFLYLTTNEEDDVVKVDLESGEWEVVISNTIPVEDHDPDEYEYEMEGITFMDLRDEKMGQMHFFGNNLIDKRIFHYEETN